jgi:hypothetical protein
MSADRHGPCWPGLMLLSPMRGGRGGIALVERRRPAASRPRRVPHHLGDARSHGRGRHGIADDRNQATRSQGATAEVMCVAAWRCKQRVSRSQPSIAQRPASRHRAKEEQISLGRGGCGHSVVMLRGSSSSRAVGNRENMSCGCRRG